MKDCNTLICRVEFWRYFNLDSSLSLCYTRALKMTVEADKLNEVRARMNREWLNREAPLELRHVVGLIEYGMKTPQWRRRSIDGQDYVREEMYIVLLAQQHLKWGDLPLKPEILSAGIRYYCDNLIWESKDINDIGNILVDALFRAVLNETGSEIFQATKKEVFNLASEKQK